MSLNPFLNIYLSRIRLDSVKSGLPFGTNPLEERSYEVYQYLIHLPNQFSVVHFSAASGTGYYTLLAQSQGLICSKSTFVVGLDRLPPSEVEMLESNDPNHVVVDLDTLKLDFLLRKSAELAVKSFSHKLYKMTQQFPVSLIFFDRTHFY